MTVALLCLLAAAMVLLGGPPDRPGRSGTAPSLQRLARGLLRRLPRRRPSPASVAALCHALVAELEAGAPPDLALRRAAQSATVVPRARAAAVLGEPVAAALAADAAATSSMALAGLAACWRAGEQSGARLAGGLARVAATAAAEDALAADLRTELAAPLATARVLLLLPLAGLLLGELLGAGPIAWLAGSPAGMLCAAVGLLLIAAGRLWSRSIIAAALPDGIGGADRIR